MRTRVVTPPLAALAAVALLAAACAGPPGSARAPGNPLGHHSTRATRPASDSSFTAAGTSVRDASSTTTNWTSYHRYGSGSGNGPANLDLSQLKKDWVSKQLDGQLYGEPLVWSNNVYVATENDTVYELRASTGAVVWSKHLGTPVPQGGDQNVCGNIGPHIGITGTPVIDTARSEIFVVADEWANGKAHHEIYGLRATTGHVEMHQNADPPGASPLYILNRASLAMDGNRVVFGYGGNWGDCEPYHGWVESVPVAGGKASFFEVDSAAGDSQGAIWMGGAAPVVTKSGDVWVAAGNGSVGTGGGKYDDSDSVLELSSSMKLLQYFAPSSWRSDNSSDADLGSAVPAVLPNGLVVQAGKSRTAFLLRASRLGGIGRQVAEISNFCGADVDGGVAFSGSIVYLPCEAGVVAVSTNASTGRIRQLWQTSTGAGGPPILAGGYVWTIGNKVLYALNRSTGHAVFSVPIGDEATDFPTPSVGDGLILAPSTDQVYAFHHA